MVGAERLIVFREGSHHGYSGRMAQGGLAVSGGYLTGPVAHVELLKGRPKIFLGFPKLFLDLLELFSMQLISPSDLFPESDKLFHEFVIT